MKVLKFMHLYLRVVTSLKLTEQTNIEIWVSHYVNEVAHWTFG